MNIVIQVAFLIFIYQFLVFLIALSLKDNSVVDVFWGMGFVLIGGFTLFRNEGIDIHKILINIAILVWGLRLSFHVLIRNWGRGEDFRYKAWRDTWKHFILRSFFQIFMLQGLFMLIIAIPIYLVNSSPSSKVSVLDFIGVGERRIAVLKELRGASGGRVVSGLVHDGFSFFWLLLSAILFPLMGRSNRRAFLIASRGLAMSLSGPQRMYVWSQGT